MKLFYCTKFVIAPAKGLHLVRAMQNCITDFFHSTKKERVITRM